MIEIEIKKQKQLTTGETFAFCISSIKHRFSRSLLTLSVVVLAVAFFMFLQSSNIFRVSVGTEVESEIISSRYASSLLGMMYSSFPRSAFVKLIADSGRNHDLEKLIVSVTGVSADELSGLSAAAGSELDYIEFFDSIGLGQRKILFGRATGREVLVYLERKEEFDAFKENLLKLKTIKIPGGIEKLSVYLAGYSEFSKRIEALQAEWNRHREALQKQTDARCGKKTLREYLTAGSPDDISGWEKILASNRFAIGSENVGRIVNYLKMNAHIERVQAVLLKPEYRQKWRLAYGQQKYTRMEDKLAIIDSSVPLEMLKSEFSKKELQSIGHEFRSRKELRDLETCLEIDVNSRKDTLLSGRHIYLMILSFIVCMVGIANAMLMSITERFREIATLKCLGATDSFILVQIIIEACIQGTIGGIAGVVIGLAAAVAGGVAQVGVRVFTTFDVSQILTASLLSLASGIFLAIIASLYPSARAARMAPMEAMRVE